jgi:hypothetical protein
MNERIGKLAVEAGAHWDHGDWNMPSAVYFSERDLEKFADLIVRECIGLLPEDCQSKNGCHTSWVMKEHFGVESVPWKVICDRTNNHDS